MLGSTIEKPNSRAIVIKNADEICIMQEANQIVAEVLTELKKIVDIGISTWELDKIAEEHCYQMKAKPAFKGYRGFPGSLCLSINEEVVHGIPSRKRKIKKGDIISIDFGVLFKNYFVNFVCKISLAACFVHYFFYFHCI